MNYRAIVERILKDFDLPKEAELAFAACMDYARNDLLYPDNNEFVRTACDLLEHPVIQLSPLESVGWDDSAHVRVSVTEDDRVEIEGDSSGLRQLARLCDALADAEEEEDADLEPETELVGDSFPATLSKVDGTRFILPQDPELTSEFISSPLRPDEVFAIQFLGPVPSDLGLTVGRIYRVRGICPSNDEIDSLGFRGPGEPGDRYNVLLRSDNGIPVNVILDLCDDSVNFISREEVSELLDED